MPAGVSWPVYLKHLTAAMLSMFAGAQFVHMIYKPLNDMPDFVAEEKKNILEERKHEKVPS